MTPGEGGKEEWFVEGKVKCEMIERGRGRGESVSERG